MKRLNKEDYTNLVTGRRFSRKVSFLHTINSMIVNKQFIPIKYNGYKPVVETPIVTEEIVTG